MQLILQWRMHTRELRFYCYIKAALGKLDSFLINQPSRTHPYTPALNACTEP